MARPIHNGTQQCWESAHRAAAVLTSAKKVTQRVSIGCVWPVFRVEQAAAPHASKQRQHVPRQDRRLPPLPAAAS